MLVVTKLLEVTATQNTGGPRQLAMLKGTGGVFHWTQSSRHNRAELFTLMPKPALLGGHG